jgi:hypothetical protein
MLVATDGVTLTRAREGKTGRHASTPVDVHERFEAGLPNRAAAVDTLDRKDLKRAADMPTREHVPVGDRLARRYGGLPSCDAVLTTRA